MAKDTDKKKKLREWMRSHRAEVASVEALRKSLERMELQELLSLVELTPEGLRTVRHVVVTQIMRAGGPLKKL